MLLLSKPPAAGYGTTSQAQQYFARTAGGGASYNGTHYTAIDTLISGLVSNNLWSKLDILYLLANDTDANARINLISSSFSPAVNVGGTVAFVADRGHLPANFNNALDTGFDPTLASSPVFTLNSGHIALWTTSTTASTDAVECAGGVCYYPDPYPETAIWPGRGNLIWGTVNAVSPIQSAATANAKQFIVCTRSGSTLYLSVNGTQVATAGSTAASVLGNMYILGRDDLSHSGAGGTSEYATLSRRIGMFCAGGYLTTGAGGDASKLYTLLNSYMTSVGAMP